MGLTLDKAGELGCAAVAHAEAIGAAITVCVVGDGGHVVTTARMDGAGYLSAQFAQDKAWTSAGIGMATADLAPIVQPGEPVFGITHPRVVTFGGGIPLSIDGERVGAIGVSGGSVDEDVEIAQAAIDAVAGVTA
ncbi:MAG: heme-binding protein [Actinomycetia bacterium]|nr:heme-binding protein [Actinomycetes bacterium]